MGMRQTVRLLLLLMMVSAVSLSLPASAPASPDVVVGIGPDPLTGSYTANMAPGSTTTLKMYALGVTNMATYDMMLSYDNSVIDVTGVAGGTNSGFTTITSSDVTDPLGPGTAHLVHFTMTGATGNVHFANVTVQAVGVRGQSATINITVNNLTDWNGVELAPRSTQSATINITDAPDFIALPTAGEAPLTVQFSDLSTGAPGAWLWDFGDGAVSTEQNPSHTYTAGGNYTVSLTTTWNTPQVRGDIVAKTAYIKVLQADFLPADPLLGVAPLTVQFTHTSTGPIGSWLWDFGDGASSTAPNPSHQYTPQGIYNVSLTVSGAGVSTTKVRRWLVGVGEVPTVEIGTAELLVGATATVPVTVRNAPAQTGKGLAGYVLLMTYDTRVIDVIEVSGGTAPGFDAVTAINIDDAAGTVDLSHYSVTEGHGDVHIANLEIRATGGPGDSTPLRVTISDMIDFDTDPLPAIALRGAVNVLGSDFTAAPIKGVAPLVVQFADLSTGAPDAWLWDFGDGATSTEQNPSHTYSAGGVYTVTLTATWDGPQGFADTAIKSGYIKVIQAGFGAVPVVGMAPLTVQFTDSSTGPANDSWLWDFGDGATSTEPNPSHTYTATGSYNVSLTVTDSANGLQDTVMRQRYVNVIEMVSETDMGQEIGGDGVASIAVKVVRAKNLHTGDTMVLDGGIGAYEAKVEFDPGGVQILRVTGVGPLSSPTVNLALPGQALFNAFHAEETGPVPPATLAYLAPRLVGSATESFTLTLSFQSIARVDGFPVPPEAPVVNTYLRGDVKADGVVSIADALFIAQYLAMLRPLSDLDLVNGASVRWDDGGDVLSIVDALFIAQYLVNLRDANFNPN